MALKNIIQRFAPPVLFDLVEKRLRQRVVYDNYAAALKDCSTPDGYETNDIVRVVLHKTELLKKNIAENEAVHLSYLDAFGASCFVHLADRKQLVVIDFGGGCGGHFFAYRKFLPAHIALHWLVVETPAMVEQGKKIENAHLKFFDDLDNALNYAQNLGKIDLFHTSGTLQCVDDTFGFLDKMLKVGADYFIFTRLGLTLGNRDLTVIHRAKLSWNGIAGSLPDGIQDRWTEYPFTFVQKSKFLARVQAHCHCISTFEENSGIFPVNNEPLVGFSVFGRRRV